MSTKDKRLTLDDIPDDLIDLKKVAKKLKILPQTLRDMSEGEFVRVVPITRYQFRVSESAAVEWYQRQSLEKNKKLSALQADWIEAEARKAERAQRKSG